MADGIQKDYHHGIVCSSSSGRFPVNLLHTLRTPFTKNTSGRLLLSIKRRLQRKCFSLKFAKFWGTTFLQNIFEQLLHNFFIRFTVFCHPAKICDIGKLIIDQIVADSLKVTIREAYAPLMVLENLGINKLYEKFKNEIKKIKIKHLEQTQYIFFFA